MIFLYTLFAISIFCPIYTYVLYPLILRMFHEKKFNKKNITPKVTVIVVGNEAYRKVKDIYGCSYPYLEVISGRYEDAIHADGEIIVFTDTVTRLDSSAITEIVKSFADKRVGAVVGQQTNPDGNSLFWKYENHIKRLESRIGCVSGANDSLFAVRKSDMPEVMDEILNKPFYIITKITQKGKDILFEDNAKTYEGTTEGTNFNTHVDVAAGYWQALSLFPSMLIPRKGSFVYISHRVMKWFVWMNMVMLFLLSISMAFCGDIFMIIATACQTVTYLCIFIFGGKETNSIAGKAMNIAHYFIMLNIAYFIGMKNRFKMMLYQ